MGIANIITLVRILLIPAFIFAFYSSFPYMPLLSAVFFTIASITDGLDGYLARHLRQESRLGVFLDPVADKLMVSSALILLSAEQQLSWLILPTIIIICRELVISALREWMAIMGKSAIVKVSILGKIKTAFQMLFIILLLLYRSILPSNLLLQIACMLCYIATLLTIASLLSYLYGARKTLQLVVNAK